MTDKRFASSWALPSKRTRYAFLLLAGLSRLMAAEPTVTSDSLSTNTAYNNLAAAVDGFFSPMTGSSNKCPKTSSAFSAATWIEFTYANPVIFNTILIVNLENSL